MSKLDDILIDFKGGVISAHNDNYGENVWNAEDFAQKQATQSLKQLMIEVFKSCEHDGSYVSVGAFEKKVGEL